MFVYTINIVRNRMILCTFVSFAQMVRYRITSVCAFSQSVEYSILQVKSGFGRRRRRRRLLGSPGCCCFIR